MKRKYKYRFKTKDEFIAEYNTNWRLLDGRTSFIDHMDYLLGTDIDECYYDDIGMGLKIIIFNQSIRYGISPLMYIKVDKKILPNYKPKTFIH